MRCFRFRVEVFVFGQARSRVLCFVVFCVSTFIGFKFCVYGLGIYGFHFGVSCFLICSDYVFHFCMLQGP